MPKKTLPAFEKQIRYCALSGIAADLLREKLISLREYYLILSILSQRYLGRDIPAPDMEQPEGGAM